MAQVVNRLTAVEIRRASAGAMLYDGNGLYFSATGPGEGSWLLRYYRYNVAHWMGLGSFRDVPLAQARQDAIVQRQVLRSGQDPIQARKDQRLATQKREQSRKLFRDVFEEWIAARVNAGAWRNPRTVTIKQGRARLHAYPVIGAVYSDQIDTPMVVQVLDPLWKAKKIVTANNLCADIEDALDYAKLMKYRDGDNPAVLKDHIDVLVPRAPATKHHASVDFRKLHTFMVKVERRHSITAEALKLQILTTSRPGEVVGAPWTEFKNYKKTKIWHIPKERMKAERDHFVPLSDPAIAILERLERVREGDFVFPGQKENRHLSETSLNALIYRMELGGVLTPHGFRATFESWGMANTEQLSAAQKDYRMYLLELCLAHQIKAAAVIGANPRLLAAYQRDELVEQRRPIMDAWAEFVMRKRGSPRTIKNELAEAAE